ncbi:hypothetical protein CspeluHIS016_0407960 [Cutaneotrichosporon spelunceum]|uniref:Uncharacterized protein n=1 Tax=Cutaneotrichosporon spelunceum TaxID=1672016 RepID=A0AAD3TW23_9TREE|nr:hypothetical protein CspeluHIS016_0407960 [Cutaneotrichosporon spelunceum]
MAFIINPKADAFAPRLAQPNQARSAANTKACARRNRILNPNADVFVPRQVQVSQADRDAPDSDDISPSTEVNPMEDHWVMWADLSFLRESYSNSDSDCDSDSDNDSDLRTEADSEIRDIDDIPLSSPRVKPMDDHWSFLRRLYNHYSPDAKDLPPADLEDF